MGKERENRGKRSRGTGKMRHSTVGEQGKEGEKRDLRVGKQGKTWSKRGERGIQE